MMVKSTVSTAGVEPLMSTVMLNGVYSDGTAYGEAVPFPANTIVKVLVVDPKELIPTMSEQTSVVTAGAD